MDELYQKYRWKACGIVALLLTVYIIFAFLIPDATQAIDTYQQIQAKKEKINSVDNWESTLNKYDSQQQKLKKFFSNLFVSVSNNDKMSAIVGLVYKKGERAGVNVQQIKPLNTVERTSFTEVPVKITALGKFHEILRFVNGLEQANRLVQVDKIDMLAKEQVSSELRTEIQLKVMTVQKTSLEEADE